MRIRIRKINYCFHTIDMYLDLWDYITISYNIKQQGRYNSMSENLHAKHLERMRKRYLATGENGFQDHELLELILFYTIPRKDTNEIAHRLLHRFQTLEGVFSASIDELTQVEDIGTQSAIFIKTVYLLPIPHLYGK